MTKDKQISFLETFLEERIKQRLMTEVLYRTLQSNDITNFNKVKDNSNYTKVSADRRFLDYEIRYARQIADEIQKGELTL